MAPLKSTMDSTAKLVLANNIDYHKEGNDNKNKQLGVCRRNRLRSLDCLSNEIIIHHLLENFTDIRTLANSVCTERRIWKSFQKVKAQALKIAWTHQVDGDVLPEMELVRKASRFNHPSQYHVFLEQIRIRDHGVADAGFSQFYHYAERGCVFWEMKRLDELMVLILPIGRKVPIPSLSYWLQRQSATQDLEKMQPSWKRPAIIAELGGIGGFIADESKIVWPGNNLWQSRMTEAYHDGRCVGCLTYQYQNDCPLRHTEETGVNAMQEELSDVYAAAQGNMVEVLVIDLLLGLIRIKYTFMHGKIEEPRAGHEL